MSRLLYRYTLTPDLPESEVEASLLLAVLAAESLHGEAQVQLDAAHEFNPERRTVTIDAATEVGQNLNRLFAGFLRREFGADSFRVERVDSTQTSAA